VKLAVIGLGNMGRAVASRMLRLGHQLIAFNRTPRELPGATCVRTVAETCAADAVITLVSDDAAIEAIALGDDGLVRHLPTGAIHISSSTISPRMTRRLAEAHARAGSQLVAAPLLGRPDAAEVGELFVVAAGAASAIASVAWVFDGIGQRTFAVSDRHELAPIVKLACNFLTASVIESFGEAMALVGKAGVDRKHFCEIVTSSLFDAPAYRTYGALIASQRYEPVEFEAALGEKDIRLALAVAESLRVPMPIASLVRDRFLRLLARDEHVDWAAIAQLAAEDAGV
jgi:3-hydroxyisobutyrate dehydrogenase-like beta-hydroxyacid dehydrogenase